MELAPNTFKSSIAAGKLQLGLWSSLCSNIVAEILANRGFDWVLLDSEHSPNELPNLLSQLQAMKGGTATPIVRPAWNDPVLIKRVLDIGATCVLIPFVENEGEAEKAVKACQYPPAGVRGVTGSGRASQYGRIKNYLDRANDNTCVLVQLETEAALDRLESIAQVKGVDGIFIGPSDLSASMGHVGNPHHTDVQQAIRLAGRKLSDIGTPAGILAVLEQDAQRYIEWGYKFVAVGSDAGLISMGADRLFKGFKS
jgi:4-hydroxy-2-oxoheptanedioate aldolase